MEEIVWKVVPISKNQKLDVRPEDLLNDGDFRKCETYRGGGGYDQFPFICEKRLGIRAHKQFIAQLYGCNLDCPYCYVTREGIWGDWKPYSSEDLVRCFVKSGQQVFHMMGGAPALYIENWYDVIERLPLDSVFHSDLLLTEKRYSKQVLYSISKKNCLFAVDIKGVTKEDYERNTRTPFREDVFWYNFDAIVYNGVPFYLTFTNPDLNHYEGFREKVIGRYGSSVYDDAFVIGLINYNATPFVDSVRRGGKMRANNASR